MSKTVPTHIQADGELEAGYHKVRMKVAGYCNYPQDAEMVFFHTEAAILVNKGWAVYVGKPALVPSEPSPLKVEPAKPTPTHVATNLVPAVEPKTAPVITQPEKK